MGLFSQIVNTFAAVIVVWGSMCSLNGMHRDSSMILRVAHVCLAVGAAAVLLAPHYLDRSPSAAELLMLYGAAVLSFRLTFRRPMRRISWEIRCLFKPHPRD